MGNTTAPGASCDPAEFEKKENQALSYLLIPAICIIIVLSVLKRRRQLCLNKCCGRPHLLIPLDFLEEEERTRMICLMMCFLIFVNNLEKLFLGQLMWEPSSFQDQEFMKKYSFLQVFILTGNVLHLILIVYPLLACLRMRKFLFANIAGLGYLIFWVSRLGVKWDYYPTRKQDDICEVYFIASVITDIPILLGMILLVIVYCCDIFRSIRRIYYRLKQRPVDFAQQVVKFNKHACIRYVENLIKRKTNETYSSSSWFVNKLKHHLLYKNVPGFRYSPRILCTSTVVFFILFRLAVSVTVPTIGLLDHYFKGLTKAVMVSIVLGNLIAFILHVAFMLRILNRYRQHLLKYYRGDKTWHHRQTNSPMICIVQSMKYPGYQIALMIYGYLSVMLFSVIILLMISCLVIEMELLKSLAIQYWPVIFISIFLYVTQLIVARLFFLQDSKMELALNNRNAYQIMSFFMVFYNALLGLFTGLKRILFSVIAHSILLSRLDRCIMIKGFERLDPGFNAYVGMIEVEHHHANPVMKAFVLILWKSIESHDVKTDTRNVSINSFDALDRYRRMQNSSNTLYANSQRSKKWRNKWFKAITLIRNPTLSKDFGKRDIGTEEKTHFVEIAIDRAGDCMSAVCCSVACTALLENSGE